MTANPEAVKQQADDLAKDFLQILEKHGVMDCLGKEELTGLLVDLSIFTVNRDFEILEHGRSLGAHHDPERMPLGAVDIR